MESAPRTTAVKANWYRSPARAPGRPPFRAV